MLLVLVVGIVAWRQLQAPSQATIRQLPTTRSAAKVPTAPAAKTINDTYAHFTFPGSYLIANQQSKTTTHNYLLVRAGGLVGVSSRVGVTIAAQDSGTLINNSSYRARAANAAYRTTSWRVDGQTIPGFIKESADDGFEMTAFWQHGTMLATISLTSPQLTDDQALTKEFEALLASWRWQ